MTNKQSGAASFIIVIFLALLLTIITLSFIRLSINEQRQATDDDLSTRAFYAAESGVEDAKRAIEQYRGGSLSFTDLNADVCEPANLTDITLTPDNTVELSSNLDTYYTCQLIDLTPGDYQADLSAWEGVTVPITQAGVTPSSVRIEWHIKGQDDSGTVNTYNSTALPTYSNWVSNNYPSMLRTYFINYPNQPAISNPDYARQTYFNYPATSGSAITLGATSEINPLGATCNTALADGSFICSQTFNITDTTKIYYLRLQALYVGTSIRISLYDAFGGTIDFVDTQALVDVTGRAGDVFRRIEARLSLVNQSNFNLPDIAIWSNEDICKNFKVTNDPADFVGLNPGIALSCR